jgi:hypothetical protein
MLKTLFFPSKCHQEEISESYRSVCRLSAYQKDEIQIVGFDLWDMTGDMFIYLSSFSYKNGFWAGFFSLFHWKPANQLYVNRLTDNKLPAVKLPTIFRRGISAFGGVTVSRIWFNRWCVGMIFVQYFIIFVCHEILKMLWFITNFFAIF